MKRSAGNALLAGQRELCFRHALIRDAAYALLTDADRAAGHRLAGVFLEAAGESDATIIAEHFDQGAERARAARLFCRAAEAAFSKRDSESAVRLAGRGIACGAQGELLGTLLALTSHGWFVLGRIDLSLPMAFDALPRVAPGSLAWTYSMSDACLAAPSGPSEWQRRLPELMAQFLAVDPQEEAEALYAETASHLLVARVCIAPVGPVEALSDLGRLSALCDRAAGRNATLRRHFHSAYGRCLCLASPTPWHVAQEGETVVRLSKLSGDLRSLHVARVMEVAWCELESTLPRFWVSAKARSSASYWHKAQRLGLWRSLKRGSVPSSTSAASETQRSNCALQTARRFMRPATKPPPASAAFSSEKTIWSQATEGSGVSYIFSGTKNQLE